MPPESPYVRRVRHLAATLSLLLATLMLIGLFGAGFTPLLPGQISCAVGGAFGAGVYLNSDLRTSRICSFWAAVTTGIGVLGVLLAMRLTDGQA